MAPLANPELFERRNRRAAVSREKVSSERRKENWRRTENNDLEDGGGTSVELDRIL